MKSKDLIELDNLEIEEEFDNPNWDRFKDTGTCDYCGTKLTTDEDEVTICEECVWEATSGISTDDPEREL